LDDLRVVVLLLVEPRAGRDPGVAGLGTLDRLLERTDRDLEPFRVWLPVLPLPDQLIVVAARDDRVLRRRDEPVHGEREVTDADTLHQLRERVRAVRVVRG